MHGFDAAPAVRAAGPQRFTAAVDPGWCTPMGPNGGDLATVVLGAMTATVGDAWWPAPFARLRPRP